MRTIVLFFIFLFLYLLSSLANHVYAQYDYDPKGVFQSATCSTLTGWTCDRNDYNQSLTVDVYADNVPGLGTYITSAVANLVNGSSSAACGGTTSHGFSIDVPDSLITASPRSIFIYPHDYPSGVLGPALNNSPTTITCSQTISGLSFSDINLDQVWEVGEPWVGGGTISTTPASPISYPTAAQYIASNLPAGVYNVYYTPPAGYEPYYPNNNGNSPFYTVQVGNSCSTDVAHGSSCGASGNISNLRFALRQLFDINGKVYVDNNRNGVLDGGESGYPFATVFLNFGNQKTTGAAGGYQYASQYAGNYTVSATVPSGYTATSPNPASQGVTLGPTANNINFGIAPYYSISGQVLIDYDNNGVGDAGYPSGTTITLTGTETYTGLPVFQTAPTDGNGNYTFSNLYAGSYTVSISPISRYLINTSSYPVNVGPNATQNFIITPLYKISGELFNDHNKDGFKNGADAAMTGNYSVHIRGPVNQDLTAVNGVYDSGVALYEGTYTVSYDTATSPVPAEYQMIYPQNGPPPSFIVTVGRSCTANGYNNASCLSAGFSFAASDIQNLDFAMSNNWPWFQCIGADCRLDGGVGDPIPSTAGTTNGTRTCSISTPGPYASIPGSNTNTPGVVFSGDNSLASPAFGTGGGQASPNPYNWQVGGTFAQDKELYSAQVKRTSYAYMQTTIRQSGLSTTDLSTKCNIAGCNLPANLDSGIYQVNGSLVLNAWTAPANKQYIFLISGDLHIMGKITVPVGSSDTFSVAGNIYVNPSVGEADPCSQACDVAGWFNADGSMTILGNNSCAVGADLRFNLCGGVAVNSGGGGGSIANQRDLCDDDRVAPSFSVIYRPDFLLYPPEFLKFRSDVWQEVAP